MKIRLGSLIILVALFISTTSIAATKSEAAKLADNALGSIKTVQADFEQLKVNRSFNSKTATHGKISIVRPNQFRLAFDDGKLLLSDGEKIRGYDPSTKTIYQGQLASIIKTDIFLLLLLGKQVPSKLFEITKLKSTNLQHRLKIVQKKGSNLPFKGLLLVLGKDKVTIEQMKIVDKLGNSTIFNFSNHQSYLDKKKNLFTIQPIKGVKVKPFDSLYKKKW